MGVRPDLSITFFLIGFDDNLWRKAMTVLERVQEMFDYLWGGVKRIFGANDDEYPDTGVQPFEGDRPKERQ